jgi:hypothetical protein
VPACQNATGNHRACRMMRLLTHACNPKRNAVRERERENINGAMTNAQNKHKRVCHCQSDESPTHWLISSGAGTTSPCAEQSSLTQAHMNTVIYDNHGVRQLSSSCRLLQTVHCPMQPHTTSPAASTFQHPTPLCSSCGRAVAYRSHESP